MATSTPTPDTPAGPTPTEARHRRIGELFWSSDPNELRPWEERFTLSATLLLLLLLLGSPATVPTTLLAVTGLVARDLLHRTWFWMAVAATFPLGLLRMSWLAWDNHHFLLLYWIVAIAITRLAAEPDEQLRRSARLLLGLTFLFATLWKLGTPDFRSGEFFAYLTVSDPRIANVLVALGLQDGTVVPTLAAELRQLEPGADAALPIAPGVWRVAELLAWATIAVEGAIAALYLAPLTSRWRWLRDAALVAFVLVTYPVAPVSGFGWLLVSMGLMATSLTGRRRTTLYLGAFLAIAVFTERNAVRNAIEQVLSLLPGVG